MRLLSLILALAPILSFSQPITVGPGGDFPTLEAAASSISAGDTVVVLDGTYNDGTQFLEDLHGTAAAPIVIKSETQHGAVFEGGSEAIHLIDCSHLILDGFRIREQSGNGINIDDGGDYTTPAHHIEVRNCLFEDIDAGGNNDFLKLSGLDFFLVQNCSFINGADGSGVDMVGCHNGLIEGCYFEDAGSSGIQAKGGSQFVLIRGNVFRDIDQRAINIGGSTDLEFFRPPLPDPITEAFEAADIDVFCNVFTGSWSPIAYVGCVRARVRHNTLYMPENWVLRILQETTEPGFLPCSDNEFSNNIVYLGADLTEVNIGPDTDAASFTFSNNLWFNESSGAWSPGLPVADVGQIIGDPQFVDPWMDFALLPTSPAIGAGKVFAEPDTDFNGQSFLNPPSIGAIEGGEGPSAVDGRSSEVGFRVFPNPGKDILYIQGEVGDLELINSAGEVVGVYRDRVIPVGHLPKGVYYIRAGGRVQMVVIE
ncbi:MAG: right-handed parallel beta-helix repeat-containing protein [Saprospirales bacterium]|nr:right-handed parallel beta-helix repeat-containing protein [Saprospirales bacterium]